MKEFIGNDLAEKVLGLIKPYTCFPAVLLGTQAKKLGKDLQQLQTSDLLELAESIGKAVSVFSNPEKGKAAKEKIMEL